MPLRQAEARKATATVRVEFPVGDLNLECREVDGATYARLISAVNASEREGFDLIVDLLERIIAAWDYLGDDGQPLPVTRETILSLPVRMILAVARAVIEQVAVPQGE